MGPVPRTADTRAGSTSSTVHTISAGKFISRMFSRKGAHLQRIGAALRESGVGGVPLAVARPVGEPGPHLLGRRPDAGLRADFGHRTTSSSRGAGPDCCSGCGGGPVAVACATRRADGASGIGPADPAYHRRVEDVPGAGEGALVVAV